MPPPAAQNPMSYPGSSSGLNPNYLNALQHQEYLTAAAQRLGELQASAGLVDPLALEASRLAAASRKRALSTSPFSDLVRNSPAGAAATANAAASPSSSGSFDALGIPHPLQQAAHLLR